MTSLYWKPVFLFRLIVCLEAAKKRKMALQTFLSILEGFNAIECNLKTFKFQSFFDEAFQTRNIQCDSNRFIQTALFLFNSKFKFFNLKKASILCSSLFRSNNKKAFLYSAEKVFRTFMTQEFWVNFIWFSKLLWNDFWCRV